MSLAFVLLTSRQILSLAFVLQVNSFSGRITSIMKARKLISLTNAFHRLRITFSPVTLSFFHFDAINLLNLFRGGCRIDLLSLTSGSPWRGTAIFFSFFSVLNDDPFWPS